VDHGYRRGTTETRQTREKQKGIGNLEEIKIITSIFQKVRKIVGCKKQPKKTDTEEEPLSLGHSRLSLSFFATQRRVFPSFSASLQRATRSHFALQSSLRSAQKSLG